MTIACRMSIAALLAAAVALASPTPAGAQLFRAYLSSQGSDVNPCTLAAPCRLLPAALAAVNDGGEIWMLDSANFNTASVNVTKSVSILAIPGAFASILAINGPAIQVNASGARVSLRNLAVRSFTGGNSGVVFTQGAQLTIEECEIYGLPDRGITVAAGNSKIVIRNSVVRDSGFVGIELQFAGNATLENLLVRDNASGILIADASKVTITDSVISDNAGSGVLVQASIGGVTQVAVERSVLRGSSTAINVAANGGIGSRATVVARSNSISGNDIGILVSAGTSTTASATIEGNVVVHNRVGMALIGTGTPTAQTRQNNTFFFNADADFQGATTPLAGQ